MRKFVIGIAIFIVVIVAALLIVPRFININQYRGRIEAELQKRLNRSVKLGQMHLSVLPAKVTVDNAVIGEDPSFGSSPFASVQQLSIGVSLWPLLHQKIHVTSLNLQRPEVQLIRNAQGQWNFPTIGRSAQAAPSPQQPSQPAPQQPQTQAAKQGGPPAFELDNLKITDGQATVIDQRQRTRAVYDHIDASLNNFAPDKNFSLSLAANLPANGAIAFSGNAGPLNDSNMIATPVDGTVKLTRVEIQGLQQYLNTQALAGMAGVISGTTTIKNQNGTVAADGSLTVDQPVVKGVNVGYPLSASYKASDDLNTGMIRIDNGNLRLGSTPLAISGTVNTRPTPMQVDLKLNAKDVSLAEAARLASAFGVAFNPNTKVDGRVSADVSAKGALSKPALNGTVSASNLTVSGQNIPQPVTVPAINLALTPQQVRSNQFTATSGSTSVSAQFTLTNYTAPSPLIDATLQTQNAQIANLLGMALAYGVSAMDGMNGSGLLTLNVHAAGPVKNPNAMTFSGSGLVQNASVQTPSLLVPLNVKNANLRFSNNAAQLQDLSASLGQTNASGNVTVRNFTAPNVQFTLSADKVNVAELQQITVPANPPKTAPRRSASPMPSIVQKMTGGGTIQIGTLQNDQLVLTNVRSNVTLNHGVISLSPLTAQLYDGLQTGSMTIDTRTTPITVQVKSSLQRVQANPLISSLSSIKNTIYGLLASNTQASFQAASASDIARTLNGTLSLDLTNGRIVGLNLLNELATVAKSAGLRQNAQAVTDVAKLTGHFNVNNGVASTNDLQADIANGKVAANGIVNLATQQLNLHLTAVLSKGFTQQLGGNGIGGLMQTALANNRGELVIPAIVTGTFSNPQVTPDLQKVAQMKLQNLLPTTANPGAASAGILGQVLGGGKAGVATSPAGNLGGILGAITGQRQSGAQAAQPNTTSPSVVQPSQQQPQASPSQQQPMQQLNRALQGIFGGKQQQQQQQK